MSFLLQTWSALYHARQDLQSQAQLVLPRLGMSMQHFRCQLQVRKAGTFRKITFTQASSSSKLLLHNLNSHNQARVSHIIKVKSSYLLFMYLFSVEMMTWRDKNFDVCSYFVSKKSNKFVVRNLSVWYAAQFSNAPRVNIVFENYLASLVLAYKFR